MIYIYILKKNFWICVFTVQVVSLIKLKLPHLMPDKARIIKRGRPTEESEYTESSAASRIRPSKNQTKHDYLTTPPRSSKSNGRRSASRNSKIGHQRSSSPLWRSRAEFISHFVKCFGTLVYIDIYFLLSRVLIVL